MLELSGGFILNNKFYLAFFSTGSPKINTVSIPEPGTQEYDDWVERSNAHANVVLGAHVRIGASCELRAGAVIEDRAKKRVLPFPKRGHAGTSASPAIPRARSSSSRSSGSGGMLPSRSIIVATVGAVILLWIVNKVKS